MMKFTIYNVNALGPHRLLGDKPTDLLTVNKMKIHLICIVAMLFTSCSDFITLDDPKDQLLTANVFKANETATAALTGIYSQMLNREMWPFNISLMTGLSGDELVDLSTIQSRSEFFTNSLNPFSGGYNTIWASAYNYIYQSNTILENVGNSPGITTSVKDRLNGEALFIRAFCYFYLVNLFGDIPIITSTNHAVNSSIARSSSDVVYTQIVSDLENAKRILGETYIELDGISASSERVRPNKWAASALLSRCYLYMKDYANAETQATEVINQSGIYSLEEDLDNVFLLNSKEAIFQLKSAGQGVLNNNTYEGLHFILTGNPGGSSSVSNNAAISAQLLTTLSDKNDKRFSAWISSIEANGVTYHYPYKYKIQQSNTISEYSVVLRLAELYLIRSEARARQGKITEAIGDLNVIRERAVSDLIEPSNPIISQDALLDSIYMERQYELFTEWGHRWLDIKRTKMISDIMAVVTPTKGGIWQDYQQLWPIPHAEIDRNPNLTQNPGYNTLNLN